MPTPPAHKDSSKGSRRQLHRPDETVELAPFSIHYDQFERLDEQSDEGRMLMKWGLHLLKFTEHKGLHQEGLFVAEEDPRFSVDFLYANRHRISEIEGGEFIRKLEAQLRNPITGYSPRFQSVSQYLLEVRKAMRECGIREGVIDEFKDYTRDVKARHIKETVLDGTRIGTGRVVVGVAHVIEYDDFEVPIPKERIDETVLPRESVRLLTACIKAAANMASQRKDFPVERRDELLKFAKEVIQPGEVMGAVFGTMHHGKDEGGTVQEGDDEFRQRLTDAEDKIGTIANNCWDRVKDKTDQMCGGAVDFEEYMNSELLGFAISTDVRIVWLKMRRNLVNPEWVVADHYNQGIDNILFKSRVSLEDGEKLAEDTVKFLNGNEVAWVKSPQITVEPTKLTVSEGGRTLTLEISEGEQIATLKGDDVEPKTFPARKRDGVWRVCEKDEGFVAKGNAAHLILVKNQVLRQLEAPSQDDAVRDYIRGLPFGAVIVADHLGGILDTSDFAHKTGGIVLQEGSETQHLCISLKSHGVPTVIKVGKNLTKRIRTGEAIAVCDERIAVRQVNSDTGEPETVVMNGHVVLNPDPVELERLVGVAQNIDTARNALRRNNHIKPLTRDMIEHRLYANLDDADDLVTVVVGSVVHNGVEYEFNASNVHDTVSKVVDRGGTRTSKEIFSGSVDAPISAETNDIDGEVIASVKALDVDNIQQSLQQMHDRGYTVLGYRRITGAVGNGAMGAGLGRMEFTLDSLRQNLTPLELENHIYEWARRFPEVWDKEAQRNLNKYMGENPNDEAGKAYLESLVGSTMFSLRIPDWGRDKLPPACMRPHLKGFAEAATKEGNWLGGIEFLLQNRDNILAPIIRGILRAHRESGRINIMIPMGNNAADIGSVLEVIDAERAAMGMTEDVKVVPLIEDPDATQPENIREIVEKHGARIAYFGLGSNDMKHTALGKKRTERASIYSMKVIPPIESLCSACHSHGYRVVICGEDGGRGINQPLLRGLGVDDFSMASNAIPHIKGLIAVSTDAEVKASTDQIRQESAAVEEKLLHELDLAATNKMSRGLVNEDGRPAILETMLARSSAEYMQHMLGRKTLIDESALT